MKLDTVVITPENTNLEELAVRLWQTVKRLRSHPDWMIWEETAQSLDITASNLAKLAGTSFAALAREHNLYG